MSRDVSVGGLDFYAGPKSAHHGSIGLLDAAHKKSPMKHLVLVTGLLLAMTPSHDSFVTSWTVVKFMPEVRPRAVYARRAAIMA